MRYRYHEILRCPISKTREAVVSTCTNGTYTLAQVATFDENGNNTSVYLKGAFHIQNVESLAKLRDLLDDSIRMIEEQKAMEEDEAWDLIEEEEAKERNSDPFK